MARSVTLVRPSASRATRWRPTQWHWLNGVLLALALGACQPDRPEALPTLAPPAFLGEQPPSRIALELTLPLSELETLIDQELPDTVARRSARGLAPEVRVIRQGPIALRGAGGQTMRWSVPLYVQFLGKSREKDGLSFAVDLEFRSEVGVAPDWRLQTRTVLDTLRWREAVAVDLGVLKINLTVLAERLIERRQATLCRAIDERVRALSLREALDKTWGKIQSPIAINRQQVPLWLTIRPQALSLRDLRLRRADVVVSLSAFTHLRFVTDSTSAAPPVPLPDLTADTLPADRDFQLAIPLTVPWQPLERAAQRLLVSQPFKVKGRQITLDSLRLSGADGLVRLFVRAREGGRTAVEFYGRPSYDTAQRVVRVRHFDYRVAETDSWLLNVGDATLHQEIADALSEKLAWPLGDRIDALPRTINRAIRQSRTGQKLGLRVAPLRIDQVRVYPDADSLHLLAEGRTHFRLQLKKIGS